VRAGPALLRGRLRRSFLRQQLTGKEVSPQVAQLTKLLARGLLTDQEYDRARRRIRGE
jgi:hypothetical protein